MWWFQYVDDLKAYVPLSVNQYFLSTTELSQLVFFSHHFCLGVYPEQGSSTHWHLPIQVDIYIVSDIWSESQPILPRYGLQRGYGDFTPNGLPTSLKLLPQVHPSLSSISQSCQSIIINFDVFITFYRQHLAEQGYTNHMLGNDLQIFTQTAN